MKSGQAVQSQRRAYEKQSEITSEDVRLANVNKSIGDMQSQRSILMNYMWSKAGAEDWHAVADAAMDLREIDAKLSVLRA